MVWNGENTGPIFDLIAVITPSGATTGTTLATSNTLTYDGVTPVEVTFTWNDFVKSTADAFAVVLRMDGSQIQQYGLALSTSGGGGLIQWTGTPTAGLHTFTAAITRIGAAGTANLQASATQPAQLRIRDAVVPG